MRHSMQVKGVYVYGNDSAQHPVFRARAIRQRRITIVKTILGMIVAIGFAFGVFSALTAFI